MSKYLTFPICLLKGCTIDLRDSLNNVMDYALYVAAIDLDDKERLEKAEKIVCIKYKNLQRSYSNGKVVFDSLPNVTPKTSITKEIIMDFYNNHKTEFEIITFLVFASIRSIIQQQAYVKKITNEYIFGRMSGNNGIGNPISTELIKYSTRHHFNKIKFELQNKWGLKLYAHYTRGYYLSFRLTIDKLILHAEMDRKIYHEKLLKDAKIDARNAALKAIYGKAP